MKIDAVTLIVYLCFIVYVLCVLCVLIVYVLWDVCACSVNREPPLFSWHLGSLYVSHWFIPMIT